MIFFLISSFFNIFIYQLWPLFFSLLFVLFKIIYEIRILSSFNFLICQFRFLFF